MKADLIMTRKQNEIQKQDEFNYMLLGRLVTDLEYFFGYGKRNEEVLYEKSFKNQILEIENLYKKIKIKPSWFCLSDLDKFAELYNK